ncbi:MAG: DNA repair protein RadC [Geminicoccaceae bacterium]
MVRERIATALQEVGLALVPDGADGSFAVKGDTFPHRDLLKRHGARWSGSRRCWLITPDGPGLAEAAAPFAGMPTARPHYHGHRERLRGRLREAGAGALADYELLELILFFSVHRRDTKPIAKAMLERFGSLGGVLAAEPARYREFLGIPPTGEGELHEVREDDLRFTQVLLKAVHDLLQRVLKEDVRARDAITSPEALRTYLRVAMRHEATEHSRILFLDRKDQLIEDEIHGRGTVDQAPLYPREVVKRALELGASAVVLVHNHPSGDPTPSKADIEATRQVAHALAQMGIALHDHLIVGSERIESLRDLGVVG